MSMYAILSVAAAKWSKEKLEHLGECQRFAQNIARAYAEYLRAPTGAVTFIPVTSPFIFGKGSRSIHELPEMSQGENGRLYVGINVHFEIDRFGSNDRFILGIEKGEQAWNVEWQGKTFDIPLHDTSKLERLFAEVAEASLRGYESPNTSVKFPMGFSSVVPTYS